MSFFFHVFSTVKKNSINAIVYSKHGLHLPLLTHAFINTLTDNPMCHRNVFFSSGRCEPWVSFIGGASILFTASLIVRENGWTTAKTMPLDASRPSLKHFAFFVASPMCFGE